MSVTNGLRVRPASGKLVRIYFVNMCALDKSSMMSGRKNYWNYFCDCLASNKYLKDGLHFVRSLTEVILLLWLVS